MSGTVSEYWSLMPSEKVKGFLQRTDDDLAKTSTVAIANELKKKSIHSILDIGCGPGVDALYFARTFGETLLYTGLDATKSFVKIANQRLLEYKTFTVEQCDLFDLKETGYMDMTYGAVLSKNVLEHCRPPVLDNRFNYKTALDHICLTSFRYLFLGFLNGLYPSETITKIKDGVIYNTFGYKEISDLLESHNIEQVERIDIIPNSVQTLLICKNREAS